MLVMVDVNCLLVQLRQKVSLLVVICVAISYKFLSYIGCYCSSLFFVQVYLILPVCKRIYIGLSDTLLSDLHAFMRPN
jgi:hypothetical protein